MLKASRFLYVTFFKWSFVNFGPGKLPEFKSIFNVSFLLIILLTNALLFTEILIKSRTTTLNSSFATLIVFGAVFFMLLNHFILLNNKWFKKLNYRLAYVSKRNINV